MITQVDFVSINVADQERAKRFYTEVLGFELLSDQPMGGPDDADGPRWIEVCPPGAFTRVVLFADADAAGAFGPCVFNTDDILATARDIEAAGGTVVEQPTEAPWGGWWGRFEDSEGNEFGMNQRSLASS
ncbi:VOC family protein [Solicola gregarius]|uniref:VOC family protein n=1 Tax=Solicola gregarius TaxID=2908642 RepID=A0AA46TJY3_9ACTN|nr:VOC family protein [Solicola gregarius]UYM05828.1 VOC family protein [Solicola gregarius]